MGAEIKLEEKIFDILKMLQKMPVLEMMRFDVRDYEFRRVVSEKTEEKIKKFGIGLIKDIVRYIDPKTNIMAKTAIGNKWAQKGKLNFDYDASLFANCIYLLTMLQDRSATLVLLKNENEYTITCDKICYRGDTMNSWATTLNAFFGVRSKQSFLAPGFFEIHLLPEYLIEFMNVVYTIGNFFPLPKALNCPRGFHPSKDYWDLALLAIYRHYKKTENEASEPEFTECTLEWVFGKKNEDICAKWLDGLDKIPDDWNHFVEQNFLQDFVNRKDDGNYGRPKELWDGHFGGEVLPVEKEEFSEFFTNASAWILARGVRIALAIKDRLTDLPEEKLRELARRMAGEEGK